MKQNREGLIFTKPNCIGCNSCIMGCPILDANKAITVDGHNFLMIDPEKCIHCGHCITACSHGSRDYKDDTDAFLSALENGEKLSLVVSPAFMLRYSENAAKILNYLRSKGVVNIYDAGFGGTIASWAMMRFLDMHPEGGFVTAECPVLVNYFEKNTLDGVQHMFPIHSSVMCMGIYIKKYFSDDSKLVYLGTCPARKDEFEAESNKGIYTYNVTFRKLLAKLKKAEYGSFSDEISLDCSYPSNVLYVYGNVSDGLSKLIEPDKLILSLRAATKYFKYSEYFAKNIVNDEHAPYISDVLNCDHGCIMGPAENHDPLEYIRVWEKYQSNLSTVRKETEEMIEKNAGISSSDDHEQMKKALDTFLSYLKPDDFRREFTDRYRQAYVIPDEVLNEVYEYMHKYTPKERTINCHTCGYGTCKDMAKAIALGINRRENCMYYEKYENQRLYLTDLFTGIPNLNSFNNRLETILKKQEADRYAAAGFSLIDNDLMYSRFGYDEVNKCIKEYAQTAYGLIQEGDILARNGDSEFLAIIDRKRMDDFLLAMNGLKIHPVVGQRDTEFAVNICAGVYQFSDDDRVGDIIGKVSVAHRAAKEKNTPCCIYYDESMRQGAIEASYLTKAFADAIRNREFVVYYQPKVDLKTMKLHGAEALVRWDHAGEFIAPARFIPLFEKNGYVVHVDFYVLNQVCQDLRAWLDAGMEPVRVSSNFSRLHISSNDIVNQIVGVIDKYEIPHNLVEIEFTETMVAGERERLAHILKELKSKGIATSIDDFGSGYSSLNVLQTMDFSVLKIDKGFLDAGIKDPKTMKIIESIIRMARDLDMQVVAEGVEKYEELEFLKKTGCDMIQGYYFDKPMPSEDYIKRIMSPDYETK